MVAINDSSDFFKIFVGKLIITVMDTVIDESNYTRNDYPFNNYCQQDDDCLTTALLCNLTTNVCQCAVHHYRNESSGFCEYNHDKFKEWLKLNHTKNKEWDEDYSNQYFKNSEDSQNSIEKRINVGWRIKCSLILSLVCFILLMVYACRSKNNRNNIAGLLAREKETVRRVNIVSTGIISHE